MKKYTYSELKAYLHNVAPGEKIIFSGTDGYLYAYDAATQNYTDYSINTATGQLNYYSIDNVAPSHNFEESDLNKLYYYILDIGDDALFVMKNMFKKEGEINEVYAVMNESISKDGRTKTRCVSVFHDLITATNNLVGIGMRSCGYFGTVYKCFDGDAIDDTQIIITQFDPSYGTVMERFYIQPVRY